MAQTLGRAFPSVVGLQQCCTLCRLQVAGHCMFALASPDYLHHFMVPSTSFSCIHAVTNEAGNWAPVAYV